MAALIALGAQPAQAAPSGAPNTPRAYVQEMDGTMHPVDAGGFITDGTPQLDASHCVGTNAQRWACLVALDPELPSFLIERTNPPRSGTWCKGSATITADVERWRPQVALYPWPVEIILGRICHESSGIPNIWNGQGSGACGLLQLLPCPPGGLDGPTNLSYSFRSKYLPACERGDCLSPWGM